MKAFKIVILIISGIIALPATACRVHVMNDTDAEIIVSDKEVKELQKILKGKTKYFGDHHRRPTMCMFIKFKQNGRVVFKKKFVVKQIACGAKDENGILKEKITLPVSDVINNTLDTNTFQVTESLNGNKKIIQTPKK